MKVNESFSRETWADEDERDLEICALIDLGTPNPEICWITGATGGEVTALREALEVEDA